MSETFLPVAHQFLGTVLMNATTNPELVDGSYLMDSRNVAAFMLTLKDRQDYCNDIAVALRAMADSFPNLKSNDDYAFKDVLGSFPSDDEHRAGWWLISLGIHFAYIIVSEGIDNETPAEFEERCEGHLSEEDIFNLIKLYTITTRCQGDVKFEDLDKLVEQIRQYDGTQITLSDLFDDTVVGAMALEYTPIESIHYQPGVIVYRLFNAVDDFSLSNLAISVRYPQAVTNTLFTFDAGQVIQYPNAYINDHLHDAIMRK